MIQPLKNNIGAVLGVMDSIATLVGLRLVGFSEMIIFRPWLAENEEVGGMIINLEREYASALVFERENYIHRGYLVYRGFQVMSVPVGCTLLGLVLTSVGNVLNPSSRLAGTPLEGFWLESTYSLLRMRVDQDKDVILDNLAYETFSVGQSGVAIARVEVLVPGFIDREPVRMSLITGGKVIDSLIPIGRGQRELIIGDQKTGKTTIVVDTILSQKHARPLVFCVYVSIGQRQRSEVDIYNLFKMYGCLLFTIIISSPSNDPVALQYLAPYAGCAMGEYFRNQANHSLVIYDDLTKHAIAYRQISLILRRPPGREAFPGDVFYLHSRLLERAAMLSHDGGGGSLTALPVAETVDGDLSAYIPTNLISITDGQIYLDKRLLEEGIQPPVHRTLSVSRVGASAQGRMYRKIVVSLKLILSQYSEVKEFEKFGAKLDAATVKILIRGNMIVRLFMQGKHKPLFLGQQIILLYTGVRGFFDVVVEIEGDSIPVVGIEEELFGFFRLFHFLENIVIGCWSFFISFLLKYSSCLDSVIDNCLYTGAGTRGAYNFGLYGAFNCGAVVFDCFIRDFMAKDGHLVSCMCIN